MFSADILKKKKEQKAPEASGRYVSFACREAQEQEDKVVFNHYDCS